ncbi:MAG: hypothetical protein HOJ35_12285, partial [Bdellovibrionales bacterium]|nr:hypothetical protein [Bdellovibrionales bacterium]
MSNLLRLYVKNLLSEAGHERARESSSLSGLSEDIHEPIIVTILDDKAADFNEDLTKFPVEKSFICFAESGFKTNVIKSLEKKWDERYESDRNDPLSIFSAYEDSKTIENVDIGLQEPIEVVYVMFTDITGVDVKALGNQDDKGNPTKRKSQFDEYQKTDDFDDFDDKKTYRSQKRKLGKQFRFSRENYGSSYMHTSAIVKQQLSLALRDLGLVRVVKDIPAIFNEEYIEKSFTKIFNDNGWRRTLAQMGYTPGRSESETKKLSKVYGIDKDSVASSFDEVLMGASSLNSKNDLVDSIENGFAASAEKFIPSIFELFKMFRENPDGVVWSFGAWLKSWEKTGQSQGSEDIYKILNDAVVTSSTEEKYNHKGKEKTRIIYNTGELDDSLLEIAKVKLLKMFADRYISWLSKQSDYVRRKDAELKLNPNEKQNYSRDRIKMAKSSFVDFEDNNNTIETDSAGFPTNLTDQQKALFFSTIDQDFRFKIATLPHIKKQDNPMGYAPTPEGLTPAEARVWRSTQDAITSKYNTDLANKARKKEGLPALPQSSVVTRVTNPMDRARAARAASKARS